LCRGEEEILEFTERVWTDDIPLVACDNKLNAVLAGIHIEVVEPEISHHFLKLPLAVCRSNELPAKRLLDYGTRVSLVSGPDLRRRRLECIQQSEARTEPRVV